MNIKYFVSIVGLSITIITAYSALQDELDKVERQEHTQKKIQLHYDLLHNAIKKSFDQITTQQPMNIKTSSFSKFILKLLFNHIKFSPRFHLIILLISTLFHPTLTQCHSAFFIFLLIFFIYGISFRIWVIFFTFSW